MGVAVEVEMSQIFLSHVMFFSITSATVVAVGAPTRNKFEGLQLLRPALHPKPGSCRTTSLA